MTSAIRSRPGSSRWKAILAKLEPPTRPPLKPDMGPSVGQGAETMMDDASNQRVPIALLINVCSGPSILEPDVRLFYQVAEGPPQSTYRMLDYRPYLGG